MKGGCPLRGLSVPRVAPSSRWRWEFGYLADPFGGSDLSQTAKPLRQELVDDLDWWCGDLTS